MNILSRLQHIALAALLVFFLIGCGVDGFFSAGSKNNNANDVGNGLIDNPLDTTPKISVTVIEGSA